MGIGNILNGDDGIGPWVTTHLKDTNWKTLDCGTVPENFTGVIKKWSPVCLVLVDAAHMNLPPGEIRRVPPEKIETLHVSTHAPPLSFLVTHLKNHAQKICIIGIQPKQYTGSLSTEVKRGGNHLIDIIRNKGLQTIPSL